MNGSTHSTQENIPPRTVFYIFYTIHHFYNRRFKDLKMSTLTHSYQNALVSQVDRPKNWHLKSTSHAFVIFKDFEAFNS